jgi:hypothetical protein
MAACFLEQRITRMNNNTLADDPLADLARLRAIAEEGRKRPLLGGRHLILWGCVIALASLLHALVVHGTITPPPIAIAVIWFGLTGAAALISNSAQFNEKKHAQAGDVANRMERAIWGIGGAFFGVITVGIFARAFIALQNDGDSSLFELFALMPAITFGVYAIILRASAEAANFQELKLYSWLSLVFVAISVLLIGHIAQFVTTAIGAVLVSVLPGRLLLRLESDPERG